MKLVKSLNLAPGKFYCNVGNPLHVWGSKLDWDSVGRVKTNDLFYVISNEPHIPPPEVQSDDLAFVKQRELFVICKDFFGFLRLSIEFCGFQEVEDRG